MHWSGMRNDVIIAGWRERGKDWSCPFWTASGSRII